MKLALRRNPATETPSARTEVRACPSCGHHADREMVFCTACGKALSALAATDVAVPSSLLLPTSVRTPASPPLASPEAEPLPSPRRRPVAPFVVSILAGLALVAAGILGWMWHGERVKHHVATAKLSNARSAIAGLEADKTRLKAELSAAQQLSNKRAALLRRSDKVLAGLTPLLSSVDELKSITGQIQTQRDTFSSDSDYLVSDLVTLGSYLIDNDPSYYDSSYVSGLISNINSEIDTVQVDRADLGTSDGSYSEASGRFDTRATSLSRAVEALKRQLKALSK